ncbi:MAG: ribose-5-phosphate isomerase RpiA [Phycisphaerales bacterium JB065]
MSSPPTDIAKDQLAQAAIAGISHRMTVGLGTGRAATRAIHALADRIASRDLEHITAVATSKASADLARNLGIPLVEMRDTMTVDVLFDGADEFDNDLQMIKGGGGAMTREKIVAYAARRKIYLVQESKRSRRIGDNFRVPAEVLEFAIGVLTARFEWLGLDPRLRMTAAGEPIRTDNGNLIVDLKMPPDPADDPNNRNAMSEEMFRAALNSMPGIVDHGLFLHEADEIIIEDEQGNLSRLLRAGSAPGS